MSITILKQTQFIKEIDQSKELTNEIKNNAKVQTFK